MKRISVLLILFTFTFSLTGCNQKETEIGSDEKVPARLRTVTGEVVSATLNEEGNIIIKESDISENARYINYEYEGITIGLLAVRDSKGEVKVVVNTCQSCGGAPYAYFVQVGNKIQCQNCGSLFAIDDLDNLIDDGCNPIAIEDKKEENGIITIGTKQLKELKDKFENWKGPKA